MEKLKHDCTTIFAVVGEMGLIRGILEEEEEEGKGKEKDDPILYQQLSCTRRLRNARTDARETVQPRIGFRGLCRLSGAIAEGGRQRLRVPTLEPPAHIHSLAVI